MVVLWTALPVRRGHPPRPDLILVTTTAVTAQDHNEHNFKDGDHDDSDVR